MSRDKPATTQDQAHDKSVSKRTWQALSPPLSEWLLEAISSMGFRQMTPVQASTIPLFMGNKDVVVEAVTGSGKTLAFLLPTIEKLLRMDEQPKRHHIGAIIVSPTRELASQIFAVLESLLAFHAPSAARLDHRGDAMHTDHYTTPLQTSVAPKVVSQLLLGGNTSPAQDLASFLTRSPNLIVATPGRLLELLSSQHVHCTQASFEMLVMDEADRLLDLGFSDTLRKILGHLPKQRRTGLFSASMTEALDQLIRVGLRNPVKVAVRVKSANGESDKRTPASLQMSYINCPPTAKLPTVTKLLQTLDPQPQKALLYFSTCAAVDYWSHILPSLLPQPWTLIPLHGKHPAQVRQRNFTRFTNPASGPTLLLTTDLAARGLDIPSVDLVLQLDPPSDPKTFVHRCGRAGRAGRRGLAVTFLSPGAEEAYISFLALRHTPINPLVLPPSTSTTTTTTSSAAASSIVSSAKECATFTASIRNIVLSDRAHHDRAQRAFVSWVRAYASHTASAIFPVAKLDWADSAAAWGLLRLPRMPELKGSVYDSSKARALGMEPGILAGLAYKDPKRERARLVEMEEYRARKAAEAADGTAAGAARSGVNARKSKEERAKEKAWTVKKEVKRGREERREKRSVKRESERKGKLSTDERAKERQVEEMVEEVRRRNQAAYLAGKGLGQRKDDDEWEGFDD